jgi:hypothetical protein
MDLIDFPLIQTKENIPNWTKLISWLSLLRSQKTKWKIWQSTRFLSKFYKYDNQNFSQISFRFETASWFKRFHDQWFLKRTDFLRRTSLQKKMFLASSILFGLNHIHFVSC